MQSSIIISWVITVAIQILFPLALAVWFARRYGVGGRVFLYGALVFFVTQMLIRTPLIQLVAPQVAPWVQSAPGGMTVYFLALAITAGLFESVGRWAGYRWLFPQARIEYIWKTGVAYGIGHAAIESILLVGVTSALSLVQALTITGMTPEALQAALPAETMEAVLSARTQYLAMTGIEPIWGGVERLLTLPLHVAMSLVVLRVFTRGQVRWLWVAVGLHGLVDFIVPGLLNLWGQPIWLSELALAVVAALCVLYILRARRAEAPNEPAPISATQTR